MKRMYTAIFAFMLTASSFQLATAQQLGPVFSAEKDEVAYGEIKQNSDKVRVLKFKNTGTEPLMITDSKGSCGCTVPEWPKEAIMPGQSGEIKISYATDRIGIINKVVYITTNEVESKDANGNPIYKQHTIKVTGNVSAE